MTKVEIVRAAFKVWGRSFYQNTSLSQLAKELGVSKAALYRHFRDKQALTEAMIAHFFDDFAHFIRADYERAVISGDREAGVFIMLRSVTEYYARNVYAFIFSLINVYARTPEDLAASDYLVSRGINMGIFHQIVKEVYTAEPMILEMTFATLTFFVAGFHKLCKSFKRFPGEEAIHRVITLICEIISGGLGYNSEKIAALDFEVLENRVMGTAQNVEVDPLLKAVAEAVAEAGPWEASMDMVARRSSLSKSSLYGHFKNKQDMLRQLFMTEFKRILAFARQGIALSGVPAEQLYLGIFSIAVYLRSRPEILVALDWLRTRKLDLGKHEKDLNFFRLFEDIDIGTLPGGEGGSGGEEEKRQASHWILFLLINILMRKNKGQALGNVRNNDIRNLYRFLTLGLKGFKKQ